MNEFQSGMKIDNSDDMANQKGMVIEILHIPTKQIVKFKSFLTMFEDQFLSDWTPEPVFGRMDPIMTFRGTTRRISLGWDVPSASILEAESNLSRCSKLMTMLYPVYESSGAGGATTLTAPPIFRVKFMNLIRDTSTSNVGPGSVDKDGLVGVISGFTYAPDLDSGVIEGVDPAKRFNGNIYPQTIKLNCEFTVLHTHKLGWDTSNEPASKNYPYGQTHNSKKISDPATSKSPGQGTDTAVAIHKNKKDKVLK